jgi:beta-lactamase class A
MDQQIDWSGLEAVVAAAESAPSCVLGIAVSAPSGARFEHHGERAFVAASTVKIAVMVELFRQVDAGRRSLSDRHVLADEDRAPGSGVILHLDAGTSFSLADLAYLMISISDNTATNLLIELVGMDNVNATMRRLGMTGSTLGRLMKGRPAQPGENENWALPSDYARLITAILEGKAASAKACDRMVALLERQQNDRRIARFMPAGNRPRWGSKTGSLTGIVNDVGFVVTGAGPMVIGVFCEQPPDPLRGEEIIGEVSRAALAAAGFPLS